MASFHQPQQRQQQQQTVGESQDGVPDHYWFPLEEAESYKHDRTGLKPERSCTDVWCFWIFIFFLAGWGFIARYAFQNGSLNRMLVPNDSLSRQCGVHSNVSDKPYLFYLNIAKCASTMIPFSSCETPQICVRQCPNTDFLFDATECQHDINATLAKLICQSDVNGYGQQLSSCSDIEQAIHADKCAKWYLDSEPFAMRCIPRNVSRIHDLASIHGTSDDQLLGGENILNRLIKMIGNKKQYHEIADKIMEDLKKAWVHIAVVLSMAVLCSIILISIMRWIARPLVWISIYGVILALVYGTYYCYAEFRRLETQPATHPVDASDLLTWLKSLLNRPNVWLCLCIISGGLAVIVSAILLMVRHRITIAIAMVVEGSKAVGSLQSTIFVPICVWTIQIGILAFSAIILMCLSSVAESTAKNSQPGVTYLHAYNVFAFFWAISFISALGDMVLAATFATWYWTFSKRHVPFDTLSTGLQRTLRYHLGTIAYGSLTIAICSIVRAVLEYIDRKARQWDNTFIRCIMCCMQCFFWCLDQFLRYLSRNAYVMCAIHGKPFCASARHAFYLLLRNCLRAVALTQITGFVFLLAKLAVTIGISTTAYLYFTSTLHGLSLNYVAMPMAIVAIGTYFIAGELLNIYAVAVDTLFMCFLEDSEVNDGTPEKPYYMSKNLVRILRKE